MAITINGGVQFTGGFTSIDSPALSINTSGTIGLRDQTTMTTTTYNFTDIVNFTRASSATYTGSDGLIKVTPASVNLLTYTQEFDNAVWTKTDSTVTANAITSPIGASDADLITEGSAGTALVGSTATIPVSTAITASFYIKRGNTDWVRIQVVNGADFFRLWVNTSTGTIGTAGAGGTGVYTSSSISTAVDGWYRVSITGTLPTSPANVFLNTASTNNSGTRVSGGTYYVWGAQLEVGSSATTYTRNYGSFYPPRFDYDPVTLQPKGLLVEEARTNLLVRSEQFDNAAWYKLNATITANAVVSPDGTSTADKLVEDTATGGHRVSPNYSVTITSGAFYTATVYVKAGERSRCALTTYTGAIDVVSVFNLTTGTVVSGVGVIAAAGGGWYRISQTFTAGASTTTPYAFQVFLDNGTTTSYAGDGTSGIYIWGAQLEAGSFPTSYIPTVASQVTRSADVATMTGTNFSSWYNQSEGTFVVEVDTFKPTTLAAGSYFAINASDGTTSEQASIRFSSTNVGGLVWDGGALQVGMDVTYTANAPEKYALALRSNDFAFVRNGATPSTDVSGTMPAVTRLSVGTNAAASSEFLNGHIRSIKYYPYRLTNAQLQSLTA